MDESSLDNCRYVELDTKEEEKSSVPVEEQGGEKPCEMSTLYGEHSSQV